MRAISATRCSRPLRILPLVAVLAATVVAAAVNGPQAAEGVETISPAASATARARSIAVPASIDATGQADASAGLIAFLESVPDDTTIEFPARATYRMDGGLKFSDRHGLTFEGHGATLQAAGGTTETSSLFALWGGDTDIVIHDFNLVGNSPNPGTYLPGEEGAHGVLIDGGSDVTVSDVTISDVYGDGFYVGSWADGVTIEDSTVRSNGRNGVSIIAGRDVTIERVAFDDSGYCTLDVESNDSSEGATNVRFVDNSAGTWGDVFVAADGAAGSIVNGLTVSANHVTAGSLLTDITLARRQNIVFTDNVSDVPADGPVLKFDHVDGLTVSGNIQPLRSGALAAILDSTDVVYHQDGATLSATLPTSAPRGPLVLGLLVLVLIAIGGGVVLMRYRSRRRGARSLIAGTGASPEERQ